MNRFRVRRPHRPAVAAIVLAATAGTEFKDIERQLAKHECPDCGAITEVNAAVLAHPFCIHCGAVTQPVVPTGIEASQVRHADPEEADVTAVQCARDDCKVLNVMDNEQLSELKTFHCVSCGTHLSPVLEACDPGAAADAGAGAGSNGGAGAGDGAAANGDANAAGGDPAAGAGAGSNGDADDAAAGDDDGGEGPKTPVGEGSDPGAGTPGAGAGEGLDDSAPAGGDAEVIEIDMCDMLDGPAESSAELFQTPEMAWLRAGGHFVAELSREKAGANRDIFETDSFAEAVATMLRKDGLRSTIEAFGFEPLRVKTTVAKRVAQLVESGVADARRKLEADAKERDEAFSQCLSISILGHATGYFTDIKNPMAEKLIASLEGLNVRGARRLVAQVMAETAKDQSASIVAKALELMGSDAKYRNDIAANLDKLRPVAAASLDDGDGDDASQAIAARLDNPARNVSTASASAPNGGNGGRTPQVAALLENRRQRAGSLSPY